MATLPPLGIIEGYFGAPWSWEDRTAVMQALKPQGYDFYIYAPKADPYLRRRWSERHPAEMADALHNFSAHCRTAGVDFGIGLSPFELHADWSAEGRGVLTEKLKRLADFAPSIIAILFDDMRGDLADLARRQADIVHAAAACTDADIVMCPSYYSDDPVLDRAFGNRSLRYLDDLGTMVDPAIGMFWTGEEVCARTYSAGHLKRVAEALRRKPVLWDNYPVNDGARMSRFLHLRGFTGRGGIGDYIAGHAINPALQPHLSLAPAVTLATSYALGGDYCYGAAFLDAAQTLYGSDLALALQADLLTLCDAGLERISTERRAALREKYSAFTHPAAAEVVRFLEGGYSVTDAEVQTQ